MPLRRRKIIFIVNKLNIGGAENIIISQANLLDKKKYDVYLGVLYPSAPAANLESRLKVQPDGTVNFNFSSLFDATGLWRVYKFLKQNKIDIVVTALFEANSVGRFAAALAGAAVIVSNEFSVYFNKKPWQKLVDKILSWGTDAIIGNAQEVIDFTARDEGIKKEKFFLIKNISDLSLRGVFGRERLRRDLGIPPDALVAMTVGRFSPEKAQHRIIEAAEAIIRERPNNNIYFLLVGFGPLERGLRDIIASKGLGQRVKLAVDPERAKEYLVAGDIFLLPSDREGQPVAMLEAMHAGLACIASAVGGVSEAVQDGVNGWLIKPGDDERLAEKIIWFFEHPAELRRMKEAAKTAAAAASGDIVELENLLEKIWEKKRL